MTTLVPSVGQKIKFSFRVQAIGIKFCQEMIFWTQYLNCLYENPDIDKSGGIKIQKILPAKID